MLTKETLQTATNDIVGAIESIEEVLNQTADGTNWTVADSLSNIAYQLERIANAMEKGS
jgi:hypothetical protein